MTKKIQTKSKPKVNRSSKQNKRQVALAPQQMPRMLLPQVKSSFQQALSAYIDARSSNGLRFYNEQALPSVPWKRTLIRTLTTDASGRLLLSIIPYPTNAASVRAQQSTITSTTDLSTNVALSSTDLTYPYVADRLNQNVNVIQARFTYVGKVLDCGGTASILCNTNTGQQLLQDNIDNAHQSLHGFVVPITNKPIVFRDKFAHLIGRDAITPPPVQTSGHIYFEGLPASTACILMEIVVLGEYFPDVAEGFYSLASHEGRLTATQQDLYTQAISVPKIDLHLHEQDHQDRVVPLAILPGKPNEENWVQKTKHVVDKAVDYGKHVAQLMQSLKPMLTALF